jgi:hypothetical protein
MPPREHYAVRENEQETAARPSTKRLPRAPEMSDCTHWSAMT